MHRQKSRAGPGCGAASRRSGLLLLSVLSDLFPFTCWVPPLDASETVSAVSGRQILVQRRSKEERNSPFASLPKGQATSPEHLRHSQPASDCPGTGSGSILACRVALAVEDLAVESVGRVAASRFLTRSLSGLSPVWNLKAADPTFGGS